MINKYTNKQRGLLAVIMAMVMVFAGAAFVAAEVDGAQITYISGDIKASQTYGDGTIVVVNDDLNIINGATLTIESGASFTVNSGVTLTVDGKDEYDKKASFIVEYGALVNIDGTLTIGEYGEASLSPTNYYVDEESDYGFFVNGTVNVVKGGIFKVSNVYTSLINDTTSNTYVEQVVTLLIQNLPGVIINDGAVLNVTSTGTKVSEISGDILLRDGAIFNMSGIVSDGERLAVFATDASKLVDVKKKTLAIPAAAVITNNNPVDNVVTSSKVSDFTITAESFTDSAYLYDTENGDPWTSDYTIKFIQSAINVSGIIQNNDCVETNAIGIDDIVDFVSDNSSSITMSGDLAVIINYIASVDFKLIDSDDEDVEIGSKIVVDDTLSVGKTGEFSAGMGTLSIEGTVNVNKEGTLSLYDADVIVYGEVNVDGKSLKGSNNHAGTLTVDGGLVVISNYDDDNVETINLSSLYTAMYMIDATGSDAVNVMYLCDLDVAVEAAAGNTDIDEIYVYAKANSENNEDYEGGYLVKESFDLPENITLIVANALIVGEDIIINIPESSAVEATTISGIGAVISVEGKIIDKSLTLDIVDEGGIVSCQVLQFTDEGATQIFTSLKLALDGAVAGDEIELVGDVDVEGTMTIPEGVTVVVGIKDLVVKQDSALVIDGVLDDSNDKVATEVGVKNGKKAGVVTVSNLMVVGGTKNYVCVEAADKAASLDGNGDVITKYNITGVYSTVEIEDIDGEDFIMSLETFQQYSSTAKESVFNGTYSAADVTLSAGDDINADDKLEIAGKLVVNGTMTLVGYDLCISDKGLFTGKVASTNGVISLKNIKGSSGSDVCVKNYINDDPVTDELQISGTPVSIDKDGVTPANDDNVAEIEIISGTAVVADAFNTTGLKAFGVGESVTLDVEAALTVSGLTINGTVNVLKDGSIATSNNVAVLGSLIIDEKAAGVSINSGNGSMFVGITEKTADLYTLSGVATVSGKVNAKTFYVLSGSSIDETSVDGMKSVDLMVEDSVWMTIYSKDGTNPVALPQPAIDDAEFLGWYDSEDKEKKLIKGVTIDGQIGSLVAKVDYNIYTVNIVADNGIGTVAIDGIVLQKNGNTFSASKLVAGEHTLSYELKNGYKGTVKMTVDGKAVDGYKFTLSGTDAEDLVVDINLSGTTQIEYSTATDSGEDDGGMTLVEILLIVLVVLVVILAVIVALRMMRS